MMAKRPIGCRTKQEWQRDQWYLRNKQLTKKRAMENKHRDIVWFKEEKVKDCANGCSVCGFIGVPEDYDYHHVDPKTKISSVADMLGTYGRGKVIAEKLKCVIVCKSCHEKIHNSPNTITVGHYPFHTP